MGRIGCYVIAFCSMMTFDVSSWFAHAQMNKPGTPPGRSTSFSEAELREFRAIHPIDIHTHILSADPAFRTILVRYNLHVLNIFVGHVVQPGGKSTYSPQTFLSCKEDSWNAVLSTNGRAKLSTTFVREGWGNSAFSENATSAIQKDFSRGAVAVTAWTNSITLFKNRSGEFAQADDPALQPIYRFLAAKHVVLISHTSMWDEEWSPEPTPNQGGPVALAARDHVLAQNPELNVMAAHLGSYKEPEEALARRLDRYPNLVVDTAGRVDYLMSLPKEKVRSFILKFQDRILYGSDNSFYEGTNVHEALGGHPKPAKAGHFKTGHRETG